MNEILVTPDFRFAGIMTPTVEHPVHVISLVWFDWWCQDTNMTVQSVCGQFLRPNWCGTINLEGQPLCAQCSPVITRAALT